MKKIFVLIVFFAVLLQTSLTAQMADGRFGDEWIDYDQSYFKILVAADGIYRITQADLEAAGVPTEQVAAGNYQLYRLGEQVPVFVSSNTVLGNGDYIEFYGQQNRSELDRNLFDQPDEEMLNPAYSLFTDTMSYFLTWGNAGGNPRINAASNNIDNAPAKEPFFMYEDLQVFTAKANGSNGHIKKRITSDGVAYSDYEAAEGFSYGFRKTTNLAITPAHVYPDEPFSVFRTRFTVNNPTNPPGHQQKISIDNQEVYNESGLTDFQVVDFRLDYPTTSLDNNVSVKFEGLNGNNDRQAVSILSLTYPRLFHFDDADYFEFVIRESNTPVYLEIEHFNHGGTAPILYDVTNGLRVEAVVENGLVKMVLPPSPTERQLKLCSATAVQQPNLTARNFINLTADGVEYLIISNPRLYNDGNGVNQVQEYANYRSSTTGGGYTTKIVDINDLYDQYAYGIHRHPLSVKNFVQKAKSTWGEDLKYLLIIGKGREYYNVRSTTEMTNAEATFFVPTYGYPGSDNLLTSEAGDIYPAVAMGRIAATSGEDIRVYLKKVKDLEFNQQNAEQTIEGRGWMKEVLHLGGGSSNGERSTIRNYLIGLADIIEENKIGANVTAVYKVNNDPVQQSQSELIINRINEGVSMLTFFGHSGVGTFDFDIDNPENYNNFGKYPLMFSLGCYSGNIHTSTVGISERFVNYEDKAAIGFGALTGLGYVSLLNSFARKYYQLAGGEQYGRGMGDILLTTFQELNSTNSSTQVMIEQFTLQGDPAVKSHPAPGPDLTIDTESVSFTNSGIVDVQQDSFAVSFDIVNLGVNIADSFNIEVTQRFPNGEQEVVAIQRTSSPGNRKSITINIPTRGNFSVGANRIFIKLDSDNTITELPPNTAENNNDLLDGNGLAGVPIYIINNTATFVYPEQYSIVNTNQIELIASTTNAFARTKTYRFQIDTTALFDSPLFEETMITQPGGLIKWTPDLTLTDNMVYYARVSPDSVSVEESFSWSNTSFIYLAGSSPGWNQSHHYQFDADDYLNTRLQSGNTEISFIEDFQDFRIKNKVNTANNPPQFVFNGTPYSSMFLLNQAPYFCVGVVTPAGNFWINSGDGDYGSINPRGSPIFGYYFRTNTLEQREAFINFIENIVPDDYYVFLYSIQRSFTSAYDYKPELWAADSLTIGSNLFSTLENQGAQVVRQLETTGAVPYSFIFQKNNGLLAEDVANSIDMTITTEYALPGSWFEGTVTSTVIGPASSWGQLEWEPIFSNNMENDTISVSVFGIQADGSRELLLIDSLPDNNLDLSGISTDNYPYLQLLFNVKDEVDRTAASLQYWRVYYNPLIDLAVNPNQRFSLVPDSLQQGAVLDLELAIENVSLANADSVLVQFSIVNEQNETTDFYKRYAPLLAKDSLIIDYQINTANLSGTHQLNVQLNPENDQPEYFDFNNYAFNDFIVTLDKINPILDVTFDGLHIMNGDLVSAKPEIFISLKDENPYLALVDTSTISVFLKHPNRQDLEYIDFTDPRIAFTPSSLSSTGKNESTVIFTPNFEEDGYYELLVQAADETGNASGNLDYKVAFNVITKQAISNFFNYPNPFSTSTQFAYTLTGDTSPDFYKIQILTVSGKIVREITQDEIGSLKVGTHLTDYRWDGTDEYGDRLANGVYLYRMVVEDGNGVVVDKVSTTADHFFKKGFGKLVILR